MSDGLDEGHHHRSMKIRSQLRIVPCHPHQVLGRAICAEPQGIGVAGKPGQPLAALQGRLLCGQQATGLNMSDQSLL